MGTRRTNKGKAKRLGKKIAMSTRENRNKRSLSKKDIKVVSINLSAIYRSEIDDLKRFTVLAH